MPLLRCSVQGITTNALLDSGSSINAVNSLLAEKWVKNGAKRRPLRLKLNTADGVAYSCGEITATVRFNDYSIKQKYVVVEDLSRNLILGRPLLYSSGVVINIRKGTWHFDGEDGQTFLFEPDVEEPSEQEHSNFIFPQAAEEKQFNLREEMRKLQEKAAREEFIRLREIDRLEKEVLFCNRYLKEASEEISLKQREVEKCSSKLRSKQEESQEFMDEINRLKTLLEQADASTAVLMQKNQILEEKIQACEPNECVCFKEVFAAKEVAEMESSSSCVATKGTTSDGRSCITEELVLDLKNKEDAEKIEGERKLIFSPLPVENENEIETWVEDRVFWEEIHPLLPSLEDNEIKGGKEQSSREEVMFSLETSEIQEQHDFVDRVLGESVLDTPWKNKFRELLWKYIDVFSNRVKMTNMIEHHIDVTCTKPFTASVRPLTEERRRIMKQLLQEMENEGVISKSNSPYSSAPILHRKKDLSYKLIIDSRVLNSVTIPETFRLPEFRDIIANIGGKSVYTKWDVNSAFHSIPLTDSSKKFTAFVTPMGKYHYNVGSYGLRNMPACLARLMEQVLSESYYKSTLVFYDDCLTMSMDFAQHYSDLEYVLQRFREANLSIKPSKFTLAVNKFEFLGFKFENGTMSCSEEKEKMIEQLQPPRTKKQLQSLLGFLGYFRANIHNMSRMTAPMTQLLKKDVIFNWNDACDSSLRELKEKLLENSTLMLPSLRKDFHIFVDSSEVAFGFVLAQKTEGNKMAVVFFGSKKLNEVQRNYDTSKREMLGALLSLEAMDPFISLGEGITYVYTDNTAVISILKASSMSSLYIRWASRILKYRTVFKHLPGRRLYVDHLSRIRTGFTLPEDFVGVEAMEELYPLEESQKSGFLKIEMPSGKLIDYSELRRLELNVLRFYDSKKLQGRRMKKEIEKKDITRDAANDYPASLKKELFEILPLNEELDKVKTVTYSEFIKHVTDLSSLIAAQKEDSFLVKLRKVVTKEEVDLTDKEKALFNKLECETKLVDDLLLRKVRCPHLKEEKFVVWTPLSLRHRVLVASHDFILSSHPGIQGTINNVMQSFSWIGMTRDISQYVRSCSVCLSYKPYKGKAMGLCESRLVMRAGYSLYCDILGPILPSTSCLYKYCLVCVDSYSRFVRIFPLRSISARVVCNCLIQLFTESEFYVRVITDNHSIFRNNLWVKTLELLSSKGIFITRYRAKSNKCEIYIQAVKRAISMYATNHSLWFREIGFLQFALNNRICHSTSYKPSFLHFGRETRSIINVDFLQKVNSRQIDLGTIPKYVFETAKSMEKANQIAQACQDKVKQKYAFFYNKKRKQHNFKIGDCVTLKNYQLSSAKKGIVGKLSKKFDGKYIIISQINRNVFNVRDLKTNQMVSANVEQMRRVYERPSFCEPVNFKESAGTWPATIEAPRAKGGYNLRNAGRY